MKDIALIIAVAVLIEALVEYGKSIADMFEGKDKKTGITQVITIIGGIVIAFAFNADVFNTIGMAVNHTVGIILTGIIASRGSNYVSDLLKRITTIKTGQ